MPLVLDGNGSMTVGNGDITGLATGALPSNVIGAGAVLQVVNATYGTQTSITSSSFVDTGLTASITPSSSSSRILVFASITGIYKSGNNNILSVFQLVRNSTAINIFEAIGPYNNSASDTNRESTTTSTTFLDSPATTSSTTYKVQFRIDGSGNLACQGNGGNSTITLMEIAV